MSWREPARSLLQGIGMGLWLLWDAARTLVRRKK